MIKNKKILIVFIISILSLILMPNISNAGLQANKGGTTLASKNGNQFFELIREMEATYGTLGTNAAIDKENGTYLDNSNNGIDCHMVLNTEWGTAGILAYSNFGEKPTTENDSTTGNDSGVFQLYGGKSEYVAGIWQNSNSDINKIFGSDYRYYNLYESAVPKAGDGIGVLGYSKDWTGTTATSRIFLRQTILSTNLSYAGGWDSRWTSRAAVVCGEGL